MNSIGMCWSRGRIGYQTQSYPENFDPFVHLGPGSGPRVESAIGGGFNGSTQHIR